MVSKNGMMEGRFLLCSQESERAREQANGTEHGVSDAIEEMRMKMCGYAQTRKWHGRLE